MVSLSTPCGTSINRVTTYHKHKHKLLAWSLTAAKPALALTAPGLHNHGTNNTSDRTQQHHARDNQHQGTRFQPRPQRWPKQQQYYSGSAPAPAQQQHRTSAQHLSPAGCAVLHPPGAGVLPVGVVHVVIATTAAATVVGGAAAAGRAAPVAGTTSAITAAGQLRKSEAPC
jgi:hypothetical protein